MDHQKQIEPIEENEYKEYEYYNNNTEYIYDEEISYDKDIDHEDLYGLI